VANAKGMKQNNGGGCGGNGGCNRYPLENGPGSRHPVCCPRQLLLMFLKVVLSIPLAVAAAAAAAATAAIAKLFSPSQCHAQKGVGVATLHFDCEVTLARHCVAQVFCSAIPVSHSKVKCHDLWQPLAVLVLEAVYEATLWAHVVYTARFRTARGLSAQPVFLTQVGGGVFGNDDAWICNAIERACRLVNDQGLGLDVRIVHYGGGTPMKYSLLEGRCNRLRRKEGAQEREGEPCKEGAQESEGEPCKEGAQVGEGER